MAKQQTFAGEAWKRKGKVTRRERFLAEMDAVIPWERVVELIRPHDYASSGQGRKPHDLTMFALANLYAVRHRLRPPQASAAP